MEKTNTVIEILQKMEYPNEKIRECIVDRASRIVHLLFDKTDNYEGPLHNGLQNNDWPSITVLVGNWLTESYMTMVRDSSLLTQDVELFYDRKYMTKFSMTFMRYVMESDIIDGVSPEDLKKLEVFYNIVEGDIGSVLEVVEKTIQSTCCSSFRMSKITSKLESLSEKQGLLATSLNAMKNIL